MKKVKKPREYYKKPYQYATCSPAFVADNEKFPACLDIRCDDVRIKDAKRIKKWLEKAIKWLEVQK